MPHHSNTWLQRIKDIEREHQSVRFAIRRLLAEADRDPTVLEGTLRVRDLRLASEHLDGTYIIRLFAEFETGLRLFWATLRDTEPRTRDLLDGIAARKRIPPEKLQSAHDVREYRNFLIHEREEKITSIGVAAARSSLCRFFSHLPPTW